MPAHLLQSCCPQESCTQ